MRLFPERRQSLRILTLKNAAWLLGILLALFIAYSIYNELRPAQRLGERRGGPPPPAATRGSHIAYG
jgi:hypothetical protein